MKMCALILFSTKSCSSGVNAASLRHSQYVFALSMPTTILSSAWQCHGEETGSGLRVYRRGSAHAESGWGTVMWIWVQNPNCWRWLLRGFTVPGAHSSAVWECSMIAMYARAKDIPHGLMAESKGFKGDSRLERSSTWLFTEIIFVVQRYSTCESRPLWKVKWPFHSSRLRPSGKHSCLR